jgi:hypothetical protein
VVDVVVVVLVIDVVWVAASAATIGRSPEAHAARVKAATSTRVRTRSTPL